MVCRGAGRRIETGISSSISSSAGDGGKDIDTGCLIEAALEGLISWLGDGFRCIEAACIVDAISTGTDDEAIMKSAACFVMCMAARSCCVR